jgi:hypothetical protein
LRAKNMDNNDKKDYEDFIKYQPENVRLVSRMQSKLIQRYQQIIRALRGKHMTVKEIHNLFYDSESQIYDYTIKTIYSHLEKLQKAQLVKISGYRMTKGSPKTEKLFIRTANLFYPDKREEKWDLKEKDYQKFVLMVNTIMSTLLITPKPKDDEVYNLLTRIYLETKGIGREIFENIQRNQEFQDIWKKTDVKLVNEIDRFVGMLIVLIRNPDIYNEIVRSYSA